HQRQAGFERNIETDLEIRIDTSQRHNYRSSHRLLQPGLQVKKTVMTACTGEDDGLPAHVANDMPRLRSPTRRPTTCCGDLFPTASTAMAAPVSPTAFIRT